MSEANRESLRRAVERWNAGDIESALELASEDLRWYPGRGVFPDLDDVNIELGQRWIFRDGLLWRYRGYSTYAEAREAAMAAP